MGAFTMPSLGADMERGRLIEWLVRPGDRVHRGDIIAVVDTAKSQIEVETFEDGVVTQLLVDPGTEVPVGTPLAMLAPPADLAADVAVAAPGPSTWQRAKPEPAEPQPAEPQPAEPQPAEPGSADVRGGTAEPARSQPAPRHTGSRHTPSQPPVSPLVRRLAAEQGIDLSRVHGSGPGGRVTKHDVERAVAHRARPKVSPHARRLAAQLGVDLTLLSPGDEGAIHAEDVRRAAASMAEPPTPEQTPPGRPLPETAPLPPREPQVEHARESLTPITSHARGADDMRAAIARLMARSKREIPHYYLSTTVDLGRAMTWMHERNRTLPVSERLVPAALILRAVALSARRHPEVNGFWIDDHFRPGTGIHLGIAISLRGGGLVAPAIHDVADLGLDDLMRSLRDVVARARSGRLRRAELADPTMTVTNLGDQGVESVHGVIYPPQVALVGVGRVVERPWAVDGLVGVRPVATVTLAADHRATDGFTGARFLDTIGHLLQEPESL